MRTLPILLTLLALVSCREDPPQPTQEAPSERPSGGPKVPGAPNALPHLTEEFRLDADAPRSDADRAGRVQLELGEDATVGVPGRWRIAYEVESPGLADGAAVYLQVPPFWGWDSPQGSHPDGPGYTAVDVETSLETLHRTEELGPGLLRCVFEGEGLKAGDRVVFDYGAGSMGAFPDLYAESGSRFWIAVDGDGDGVRHVHEDSPSIRIRSAPASRVVATLPSRARPGELVRLAVALLDPGGNRAADSTAELSFAFDPPLAQPGAVALPETSSIEASDEGAISLSFTAPERAALQRIQVTARVPGTDRVWKAVTNPLLVEKDAPRMFWADLHGHSNLSDGSALPEEYLRYARDVAALDIIALTDHDHYGVQFLADHPELWRGIREDTQAFHVPGRFVTVLGYEWTNWTYGHRHVLYFQDDGEIYDSIDPASDEPRELWTLLADLPAMTIAHHSAGAPVATDWSIPPDSTLEPVTEIMSVHGSSEAEDSPARVRGFLRGNASAMRSIVATAWASWEAATATMDIRVCPHLNPTYGWRPATEVRGQKRPERLGQGGVTAVFASELSREAVLQALRDRRSYATSGPRILLSVQLAGAEMGQVLKQPKGPQTLRVQVHGTSALRSLELIRSGKIVETLSPASDQADWPVSLEDLRGGGVSLRPRRAGRTGASPGRARSGSTVEALAGLCRLAPGHGRAARRSGSDPSPSLRRRLRPRL